MENLPKKIIASSFNRSDITSFKSNLATIDDENDLQNIVDNELNEQFNRLDVEGQHRDSHEVPLLEQLVHEFGLSDDEFGLSDDELETDAENEW